MLGYVGGLYEGVSDGFKRIRGSTRRLVSRPVRALRSCEHRGPLFGRIGDISPMVPGTDRAMLLAACSAARHIKDKWELTIGPREGGGLRREASGSDGTLRREASGSDATLREPLPMVLAPKLLMDLGYSQETQRHVLLQLTGGKTSDTGRRPSKDEEILCLHFEEFLFCLQPFGSPPSLAL